MKRTYLILDALQDRGYAQGLSRAWLAMGFTNAVDPAGQEGWVELPGGTGHPLPEGEGEVDRAAGVARGFGVEVRDRVGATFRADNDLAALRAQMAYEYKSRLATALVFGLPAIVLHYVGARLAGGGHDPRTMMFPWFFELLLVGWACLAGGWPVLWQGALAAVHLRATADLLTTLIVVGAFLGSVAAMAAVPFAAHPWLSGDTGHEPVFYVAMGAMILALLQRWLLHRSAERLAGRSMLMLPGLARWMSLWMLLSVGVAVAAGPRWGLTVALLMPPLIGLGAINPWSPGLSMLMPVLGFAFFLALAPGLLHRPLGPEKVEIAAGFQLVMIVAMGLGWRRFPR